MHQMKLFFSLFLLFTSTVFAYLGENYAPFTISLTKSTGATSDPIVLRRGDSIQIRWMLTPNVRLPLYGYASATGSKTEVGLLAPDSSRTQSYVYLIDTDVSLLDSSYTWTVGQDVRRGLYQIGMGIFYHEKSPYILIV